jgi:hypothetical protein
MSDFHRASILSIVAIDLPSISRTMESVMERGVHIDWIAFIYAGKHKYHGQRSDDGSR